jgi:hypothetical protein
MARAQGYQRGKFLKIAAVLGIYEHANIVICTSSRKEQRRETVSRTCDGCWSTVVLARRDDTAVRRVRKIDARRANWAEGSEDSIAAKEWRMPS